MNLHRWMTCFSASFCMIAYLASSACGATVDVFHKLMPPSIDVLMRAYDVLADFEDVYQISYHVISDSSSSELIQEYGLPDTHFPFAVVINGCTAALINGERVDFVDFPLFMHGIGRHEGNWSIEDLEAVLSDTSLLVQGDRAVQSSGVETSDCLSEDSIPLVDRILADAISYLGAPYVWGGSDASGFDCSGLAWRVFTDNGVPLPRTVSAMEEVGIAVDRDELLPGDLLIFDNPVHTGIYLGDGEFIHCSSYQDRGVVITPLSNSNYSRRYSSARRVLNLD